MNSGAKAVIVEGAPVARSNTANDSGADVFLPTGFVLTMGEALASEVEVGIALERGTGTFTSGYATSNGDRDPDDFFIVAEDLEVALSDGEAQVIATSTDPTEVLGEAKGSGGQLLSVQGTSPDFGARGVLLSANAEGDITVGTWGELQAAINEIGDGHTIALSADLVSQRRVSMSRGNYKEL